MKEFKFNYYIPREYTNKEGVKCWALPISGEKMGVDTLANIQKFVNIDTPKGACPYCQVFNNGFRVVNNNIIPGDWNGFTFVDFDSKWFYDNVKTFNVELLKKGIATVASKMHPYCNNFYCIYTSASKKGFRILFYWNCDKTVENFDKCCMLSEKYIREICYTMGKDATMIVDYAHEFNRNQKTIDSCSKSSKQGFYVTKSDIIYSPMVDEASFGECDVQNVSLADVYKDSQIHNINIEQHSTIKGVTKNNVDKDKIQYYPHHFRRCIYEALIVVYKERNLVDTEWKCIANMLPPGSGHDTKFYAAEPTKNKWYDRFNDKIFHNILWLEPFGYNVNDTSEYIYIKQFKKSWKKRLKWEAANIYADVKTYDAKIELEKNLELAIKESQKKELIKKFDRLRRECFNAAMEKSIFDLEFYNIVIEDINKETAKEEELEKYNFMTAKNDRLIVIRSEYYKTNWKPEEFKHLCDGYEIAKDINTYKFYADFYYRDKDNLPKIKYDCLEDNIECLSYDQSVRQVKYHSLKSNEEFTHWCNNDTFSNNCKKEHMRDAINKYASRFHGYHVIHEFFESLKDIKPDVEKLETYFIRYQKVDDTPLNREISKNFLIAAVKKIFVDDPKSFVFPHMLYLQGPTGCGKTYMLTHLFTFATRSFILNKVDMNAPDEKIGPLIAKNLLIQFGEGENLKKTSIETYKEFIDRINMGMKYQKKYENEQTTVYPRVVTCLTSNNDVLFNDVSVDMDRRAWILESKRASNDWIGTVDGKQFDEEIPILWATAYKLYLENPDINLELSMEFNNQLADVQSKYKLIKDDEISEIYNDIFNRKYQLNSKGEFVDEYNFRQQIARGENIRLTVNNNFTIENVFDLDEYNVNIKFVRIPKSWIKTYVTEKYGINTYKLLDKYILKNNWDEKVCKYGYNPKRCYEKTLKMDENQ